MGFGLSQLFGKKTSAYLFIGNKRYTLLKRAKFQCAQGNFRQGKRKPRCSAHSWMGRTSNWLRGPALGRGANANVSVSTAGLEGAYGYTRNKKHITRYFKSHSQRLPRMLHNLQGDLTLSSHQAHVFVCILSR